jgi:hypothetical protein
MSKGLNELSDIYVLSTSQIVYLSKIERFSFLLSFIENLFTIFIADRFILVYPGASYDEGLDLIFLLHILHRHQTLGIMYYIYISNLIPLAIVL